MCRVINYNPDIIKPFLCKPLDKPRKRFYGEAAYAKADDCDSEYMFHVTRLANFRGILKYGLLSCHGSSCGAGEIIAKGKFRNNEIGYVFATSYPYTVDRYIYNYDKIADELKSDKNAATHIPILLRFKPTDSEIWITDPKDKNAKKTKSDIAPQRLDLLSYEGWISLKSPLCRGKITLIIDEILN